MKYKCTSMQSVSFRIGFHRLPAVQKVHTSEIKKWIFLKKLKYQEVCVLFGIVPIATSKSKHQGFCLSSILFLASFWWSILFCLPFINAKHQIKYFTSPAGYFRVWIICWWYNWIDKLVTCKRQLLFLLLPLTAIWQHKMFSLLLIPYRNWKVVMLKWHKTKLNLIIEGSLWHQYAENFETALFFIDLCYKQMYINFCIQFLSFLIMEHILYFLQNYCTAVCLHFVSKFYVIFWVSPCVFISLRLKIFAGRRVPKYLSGSVPKCSLLHQNSFARNSCD